MMVNSTQLEIGGGCTPSPFTISAITSKVVVYAPAERADTLILFLLYPFLLCGSNKVLQKDSYKRGLGHKKYCTAEN
jgi:hypothetical protein